jgi:hypothetical protein
VLPARSSADATDFHRLVTSFRSGHDRWMTTS